MLTTPNSYDTILTDDRKAIFLSVNLAQSRLGKLNRLPIINRNAPFYLEDKMFDKKEYIKKYRETHKAEAKENKKRWYLEHKQHIREYDKKRIITPEQKERIRLYQKEYGKKHYEKNKEYMKLYSREYVKTAKGRENYLKRQRKFNKTPKGFYKSLKRNSWRKGNLYLSQKEFLTWYEKQDKICYYCLVSQDNFLKLPYRPNLKISRLTIDRCDNKKGYEIDNIVLACDICNSIKSDILTIEEMKIIGREIIGKKWKNYLGSLA